MLVYIANHTLLRVVVLLKLVIKVRFQSLESHKLIWSILISYDVLYRGGAITTMLLKSHNHTRGKHIHMYVNLFDSMLPPCMVHLLFLSLLFGFKILSWSFALLCSLLGVAPSTLLY